MEFLLRKVCIIFAAPFGMSGVALVRNASIIVINQRKDCVTRTCMSGHSHTRLSTKLSKR